MLQEIIDAINNHEPVDGSIQWYTDKFYIDCDAEEFWDVVGSVIARYKTEE